MSFFQILIRLSSVSVVTSALTLLSLLALAKIMEPADFGKYSYFQSASMILLNVAAFGSSLALAVFLYKGQRSKLDRIVSNVLFMLLPMFVLISLFLLCLYFVFFANDFDLISVLVVFNVLLMAICLLGIDYLRACQRIKLYSLFFLGYTSCTTLIAILGYVIGNSVLSIYCTVFFALLIPSFFTVKMFLSEFNVNFSYKRKFKVFSWSIKYGFPVITSTAVMSFLVIGDKIILGMGVSSEELAYYSVATLLSSTTLFLVNNFAGAWCSYLFKFIPSKVESHGKEGVELHYNSLKKNLLLVIPASFFIYIFQYIIYMLMFKDKYPDLEISIYILTLGYCIFGASKYFMGYLNYFGRNIIILYTALAGCLLMFFLVVFAFNYSIVGTAISVALSLVVQLAMIWWLTDREFGHYLIAKGV
jgi:O-antigen/teichoic acid export membrane protein